MNDAFHPARTVPDRLDRPLRAAFLSWEALLVAVAISIFVANSLASPYFLNAWSLSDLTFNFTEKALIALAVSHAEKCPYCIDAYTTACLEAGANPEQMMEAVHVAAVMKAGITLVHAVRMQNHLGKLVL